MISIVTTVVVPHLYMPQNNSETIKQNDDLENKLKAYLSTQQQQQQQKRRQFAGKSKRGTYMTLKQFFRVSVVGSRLLVTTLGDIKSENALLLFRLSIDRLEYPARPICLT